MRWHLLALVTFASAVTLLGQTSNPAATTPTAPTKETKPLCTVSGRVVTAADGSPLRSSRVALTLVNSQRIEHIYFASSDNDGHFLIKDVPAGQYTFFAFHAGYVQQHYKSQGDDEGAVLTLTPGQKVDDALFRLTRAAVITGRVMNEEEEPLIGVDVVALQKPSEDELDDEGVSNSRKQALDPAGESQTDDRGQYRIFGLKPGAYYIRASDKADPPHGMIFDPSFFVQLELGSEYGPSYFPGVAQVAQAEVISLKPGEETQADVTLRHIKTANVAGRVIGPTGPVKRTAVTLRIIEEDDFSPDYQSATDEAGAFSVKGVPPGSYILSVYQKSEPNGPSETTARQKIEVNGENIENLTITTGVGATIQARVRSSGSDALNLDGLGISLAPTDESNSMSGFGRPNKDGTFAIKSLPEGTYALHLWGLEQGWYMKSAQFGGEEVLEKGLQLENASSGGRLEIVVSSASAQLEGSVVEDDQTLAGATVRVTPDPETPYNKVRRTNTRTDQTGHYSFPGLAPGKYQVIVRSPTLVEGGHPKSEPQAVTLSEHDKKTLDLKIVTPKPE